MSDENAVTPTETQLQTYLERPLTPAEQQQLNVAIQQNPALADSAALLGLLRELRLDKRMAKAEDAAWQSFSQLARNHQHPQTMQNVPPAASWLAWLASLWGKLQPAVLALASVVIMLQAGGLVWLSSKQTATDVETMRGGAAQTCPAVVVRFTPNTPMADVSQILTQAQASIVSGPDAAGFYRLVGPATFPQDAAELLHSVATDTRTAPDCTAAQP